MSKRHYHLNKFKTCNSDSRQFYYFLKILRRSRWKFLCRWDNFWKWSFVRNNRNHCRYFQHLFVNVAKMLSASNPIEDLELSSPEILMSSFIYQVTNNEIYSLIINMKNKSSSSVDKISNKTIKSCCDTITHAPTKVVNDARKQTAYASELSKAKTLPKRKEGSKLEINHYWSIALLSSMSKIFERVIFSSMWVQMMPLQR